MCVMYTFRFSLSSFSITIFFLFCLHFSSLQYCYRFSSYFNNFSYVCLVWIAMEHAHVKAHYETENEYFYRSDKLWVRREREKKNSFIHGFPSVYAQTYFLFLSLSNKSDHLPSLKIRFVATHTKIPGFSQSWENFKKGNDFKCIDC